MLLLDLILPSLDGISVCRMLRRTSKVPIIMLTARGAELDRIMGLESGADDYVVKPFSLGELLARVRALLRRTDPAQRDSGTQLQSGDLHLDLLAQRAQLGAQELRLTHHYTGNETGRWRSGNVAANRARRRRDASARRHSKSPGNRWNADHFQSDESRRTVQ